MDILYANCGVDYHINIVNFYQYFDAFRTSGSRRLIDRSLSVCRRLVLASRRSIEATCLQRCGARGRY